MKGIALFICIVFIIGGAAMLAISIDGLIKYYLQCREQQKEENKNA